MRYFFSILCLTLLVFPPLGWGQEIPKELNTDLRKAGKSHFVVSPVVGLYVPDTTSTSLIYGGQLAYNWTRHFATAVDFGISHLEIDPQSAYGQTVTRRTLYHFNGAVMGVVPAALRFSHHKATEMDLYGMLGAGYLNINSSKLPNGMVGIGSLIYLAPPRLALRAEARSYLYKLPILRGGFSIDTAILVGFSFFFSPAIF